MYELRLKLCETVSVVLGQASTWCPAAGLVQRTRCRLCSVQVSTIPVLSVYSGKEAFASMGANLQLTKLLKAGPTSPGHLGQCPVGFGISLRMEIAQPPWATSIVKKFFLISIDS